MKHFETLKELNKEWKKNDACKEGVKFNKSCKTLQECLEKCPLNFRLWRLKSGYLQFSEHCQWEQLSGSNWSSLLTFQPQLSIYCEWEKLNGRHWSELLKYHPQFASNCDWSKLKSHNWLYLLTYQPQLEKFRDQKKLHKNKKP